MAAIVCVALSAFGQKKSTKAEPSISADEWHELEVFEQHKLYPRVNVVPYAEVDDIEKLAYKDSPYYISLNGQWRVVVSRDFLSRPQNMESPDFSTDGWSLCEVPSAAWSEKGNTLLSPSVKGGSVPTRECLVFTYAKEFKVPAEWSGYKAFLKLQARSAFYVWVNKHYVGYSEDSRAASEFDITPHLLYDKPNTVVVQVVAASDGSLLECAFPRDFNGLTDDVSITLKPGVNVRDYVLRADYDAGTSRGTLSIDATVNNIHRKGRYYLEAEIWTPEGREHAKVGRWVYFDKKAELHLLLDEDMGKVKPWTAETPNLYTAVIRLRDEKMNMVEAVGTRFGFRTIEVADGRLTVNGRAVKLRGVLYSGYDMATGELCTPEQMEQDIRLMKRNNVNAVRTTVFSPLPEEFYQLCSKYGLYVVCDANLIPYATKEKVISVAPEYGDLFVVRMQNMYETCKNHTSIIAWSLGGGVDNGMCMESAYRTLKAKDSSRPVVFGGAQYGENSDLATVYDATSDELKQYIKKNIGRPLLLASYGNASGNACGGIDDFWKTVKNSATLAGGFFNCWRTYRYTDMASWAELTRDGIANTPSLTELRQIYRGIELRLKQTTPDEAEFVLVNCMDFSSMSDYVLDYSLFTNYKKSIVGGEVPQTLAPGEATTFRIRVPRMRLYSDEELRVRFVLKPRKDQPGVPRTTELASFEFALPMPQVARVPLGVDENARLDMSLNDSILHIGNEAFSLDFDVSNGFVVALQKGGNQLLAAPLLPNFCRVPTNNDCVDPNALQQWQNAMPSRTHRLVEAVSYRRNDQGAAVIDVMSRYINGDSVPVVDVKQVYYVLPTGDVLVDNEVQLQPALKGVAKIGMQTRVPRQFAKVSWFGGVGEHYPDRRGGVEVALNNTHADSLFFRYDRPQEAGNHVDVRWLSVGNGSVALFADMCDTNFNFSIYPYTDMSMLAATSYADLAEEKFYTLNIDYKVAGIGSALSGNAVEPPYRLADRRYHYLLHLRLYDMVAEAPSDMRRQLYPRVESGILPTPSIRSDRERFDRPMTITISDTAKNCELHYTLDGSEPTPKSPLYKQPLRIDKTTVVKARAFAPGMTPSFVATRKFNYDYVVSTTFEHAPNTPYNHNAAKALFDGETGSVDDLTRGWLGFSGNDVVVVVTLAKPISVDHVTVRFAHAPDAWVFAPVQVKVEVSADGQQYKDAKLATISYDPASEYATTPDVKTLKVGVMQSNVKFIKISAKSIGKLPPWHKAKGLKPWMMLDELYVIEN